MVAVAIEEFDEHHTEFDPDTAVALHPLIFLDEGEEVTVGRLDADSYCILPKDGAAVLRQLSNGMTPRQTGDWYLREYEIPVNITEFLEAMEELGFLATPADPLRPGSPVRCRKLGQALFSPLAWLFYAVIVIAAVVVMIRDTSLAPHYSNMFFTPYISVVVLTLFFGQVPFLLFHESFHMLAGRRLGLRSRVGIGRRLFYVVAETNLDGLVMVPRRRRYLPILAGILADVLAIAVLTLIAALLRQPGGHESLIGGICLALAFANVLRVIWQFYFHLETDIYQTLVTVLGCVDLHRAAKQLVLRRVRRILRQDDKVIEQEDFHPRDLAAARWYSWLVVVGYAVSIGTVLVVGIPTIIRIASVLVERTTGDTVSGGDLADMFVFILLNVLQAAVLVYVIIRDRRRRRNPSQISHSSTE